MKQTKLSDIIEKNVDDKLYLKKKDFEKNKRRERRAKCPSSLYFWNRR